MTVFRVIPIHSQQFPKQASWIGNLVSIVYYYDGTDDRATQRSGMTEESCVRDNKKANAETVPALLSAACTLWPDNDLAVFDNESISYQQAETRSANLAQQLISAGVGRGTHVGILLPNGVEFILSYLAINRIGAVAIPISTFSTADELLQLLQHADVQTLLMASQYRKHNYLNTLEQALPSLQVTSSQTMTEAPCLRSIMVWGDQTPAWAVRAEDDTLPFASQSQFLALQSEVRPGDVAAIVYTSGSTSAPKGVIHSQYTLLRQSIKQAREKDYRQDDRIFSSMPFFWVGGLSYTLLPAMQAGATVLGCDSAASKDILDFIEREAATWFLGWPHAGEALEQDPSFPSRNLTIRGGYLFGALPENLRPPSPEAVCNSLGMTETAGPHSRGHLSILPEHLYGSFGQAADGIEYRVVDLDSGEDLSDGEPGELLVRGDTLMLGFYKHESASVFTPDGWYPTRDLVIRREGHIFFQGRCDDTLKIRGANVSPKEVENALNALPNVSQSLVTVVTHGSKHYFGAVLVTTPGTHIDLDAVPLTLRERLSAYKVPTLYASLPADQLPFRSSGKIDRKRLIALLLQKLEL